jgi:hypothetical protein
MNEDKDQVKGLDADVDDNVFGDGTPETVEQVEAGSVISRLRELRKEHTEATTRKIELPGYQGELIAEYAPLPWDVVRGLAMRGERGKRNPQIAPIIAADGLANAIQGFFYRDPETGKETPLSLHGEPIESYGKALAQALGIDLGPDASVREIVRAVFPDEFALVAHYGALMDWQAERSDDDEERLVLAAKGDEFVHPTSS